MTTCPLEECYSSLVSMYRRRQYETVCFKIFSFSHSIFANQNTVSYKIPTIFLYFTKNNVAKRLAILEQSFWASIQKCNYFISFFNAQFRWYMVSVHQYYTCVWCSGSFVSEHLFAELWVSFCPVISILLFCFKIVL